MERIIYDSELDIFHVEVHDGTFYKLSLEQILKRYQYKEVHIWALKQTTPLGKEIAKYDL